MQQNESVCGAIVTFHPDSNFSRRLTRITAQCRHVVIVDNASNDEARRMLADIVAGLPSQLSLIQNESNCGLAFGLNLAFDWAKEHGFRFVIAFDQDTTPTFELTGRLLHVFRVASATSPVAVAGAAGWDFPSTSQDEPTTGEREYLEVTNIVTSGMLVSLEAYEAIGPFRNEFFVYSVDTEYCLRARARGYRVILVERAYMNHRFGNQQSHRVFGRQVWASNYNASRRYMIARSTVVLIREYGAKEPRWALRAIRYTLFRDTVKVVVLEEDKLRKIKAILRGIADGITFRSMSAG